MLQYRGKNVGLIILHMLVVCKKPKEEGKDNLAADEKGDHERK